MPSYNVLNGLLFYYDREMWIRVQDIGNINQKTYTDLLNCAKVLPLIHTYGCYHSFEDISLSGKEDEILELYESDCPFVTDEIREEARQFLMGYPNKVYEWSRPVPRPTRNGHIYVVHTNGYHKIGRSSNVKERINGLRATVPTPLELICTIPSTDTYTDEKNLHERFDDKRTQGEWFELTEEDIEWLRQQEGVITH